MHMESDCLFCKMVNRQTPSAFLHEDDDFIVVRDINPAAPIHLLLIPKKHIRSIKDLEKEDGAIISKFFMLAKDKAKDQGINTSGYKLLFNVEQGGGQEIFHIHLHLIGGWKRR